MRVVSYNVHRGEDDGAALARVVAVLRPDLMCLQEAPSWWGSHRRRRKLAAQWGMEVVGFSARNVVVATRATAARVSVVRRRRVWRPPLRRRLSFVAPQIPGGLVEVTLGPAGDPGRLAVCSCHLGLSIPGRRSEAAQLVTFCAAGRRPVLLVGDLNEELAATDGGVGAALTAGGLRPVGDPASYPPTFPTWAPDRRIDAAMASDALGNRCRRVALEDVTDLDAADLRAASDHLPVLVEIDPA